MSRFVAAIVGLKLALHLSAMGGYGYHGDELYYLACASHLDWGYVDHPPLAVWLLAGIRALLGNSLVAIRIVPVLTGAATIGLAAAMARALGGGGFAAALAATAVLVSGLHLAIQGIYTVNAFDLLWWALAQYLLIRLIARERPVLWAALALVMGLGLLTKLSMLWFGGGLAVAIVATEQRRWLATPAPWLTALGALALGSPYLFWQIGNDWPTWAWLAWDQTAVLREGSLLGFVGNQTLAANPINLPIWLAGLTCLLFAPFLERFRLLGVQALAVLVFLAWSAPGVVHYPAPVYAVLFAAGGVALERATERATLRRVARPLALGLMLLVGAAAVPLAIPILPVDRVEGYVAGLGIEVPEPYGRGHRIAFPQQFSTMLARPETVEATARVWKALPPEERDHVAIFGVSYTDAAAVDLFGPRYGLPRAISTNNAYALWGPRHYDLETVVVVGAPADRVERWWSDVRVVETVSCLRCESWRREIPIVLARKPRTPMPALWDELQRY